MTPAEVQAFNPKRPPNAADKLLRHGLVADPRRAHTTASLIVDSGMPKRSVERAQITLKAEGFMTRVVEMTQEGKCALWVFLPQPEHPRQVALAGRMGFDPEIIGIPPTQLAKLSGLSESEIIGIPPAQKRPRFRSLSYQRFVAGCRRSRGLSLTWENELDWAAELLSGQETVSVAGEGTSREHTYEAPTDSGRAAAEPPALADDDDDLASGEVVANFVSPMVGTVVPRQRTEADDALAQGIDESDPFLAELWSHYRAELRSRDLTPAGRKVEFLRALDYGFQLALDHAAEVDDAVVLVKAAITHTVRGTGAWQPARYPERPRPLATYVARYCREGHAPEQPRAARQQLQERPQPAGPTPRPTPAPQRASVALVDDDWDPVAEIDALRQAEADRIAARLACRPVTWPDGRPQMSVTRTEV